MKANSNFNVTYPDGFLVEDIEFDLLKSDDGSVIIYEACLLPDAGYSEFDCRFYLYRGSSSVICDFRIFDIEGEGTTYLFSEKFDHDDSGNGIDDVLSNLARSIFEKHREEFPAQEE